jgi:hypothetical protein
MRLGILMSDFYISEKLKHKIYGNNPHDNGSVMEQYWNVLSVMKGEYH